METVTALIAYDITDNTRRSRIAARLQSVGDRIQRSVFVTTMTSERLDDLVKECSALMNVDEDSIFVVRQCSACWNGLIQLGQASAPTDEPYWISL